MAFGGFDSPVFLAPMAGVTDRPFRQVITACGKGNMYAMIKEILRQTGGPDIGGVREPLLGLQEGDKEIAKECVAMISAVKAKL